MAFAADNAAVAAAIATVATTTTAVRTHEANQPFRKLTVRPYAAVPGRRTPEANYWSKFKVRPCPPPHERTNN